MIMRDFMNRQNRDKAFKEMQGQGITNIHKSSIRNQLLHPQYVEDWPYPLSQAERGFGNTIYKTHFSVLYSIREI